jgi:hypothetical protein
VMNKQMCGQCTVNVVCGCRDESRTSSGSTRYTTDDLGGWGGANGWPMQKTEVLYSRGYVAYQWSHRRISMPAVLDPVPEGICVDAFEAFVLDQDWPGWSLAVYDPHHDCVGVREFMKRKQTKMQL